MLKGKNEKNIFNETNKKLNIIIKGATLLKVESWTEDWGLEKEVTEDEMVEWLHLFSLSKLWEIVKPGVLQSMGLQIVGHNLAAEQQ